MESEEAIWKSIEHLRESHSHMDKCLGIVQHEQEMQRKMITEQHAGLASDIGIIRAKLDTVAADIHEARGGLRVGRWLGATMVTLVALEISLLAYLKGVR